MQKTIPSSKNRIPEEKKSTRRKESKKKNTKQTFISIPAIRERTENKKEKVSEKKVPGEKKCKGTNKKRKK